MATVVGVLGFLIVCGSMVALFAHGLFTHLARLLAGIVKLRRELAE